MKTRQYLPPWAWIPTLYFAEGIPYFVVNNISVMMFTKMGVPNGQMALFTSLLYLPWTIKPFWSPFVDLVKTKRWWIIGMQLLMTAAFALLALTLPHPEAATLAAGQTPVSLFTLTLCLFVVTAFASATHDIAADGFYMLALTPRHQANYVGIRSTFYRLASVFGQGVLVAIAGALEASSGNIPRAWQLTLLITATLFGIVALYHTFVIPHPAVDHRATHSRRAIDIIHDFAHTFVSYFAKPGVWIAITFMLLYRLPEAFLLKMCMPFLVDTTARGGLALSTTAVGLAYGTIGVAALTVGGIIGGFYAAHVGLKRALWPMALALTLPCSAFLFMALSRPGSLPLITTLIAVDQFGYGFGFTAYMLYMIRFSEGSYKTSHYAICTAFMALSMMLPGMVAGYLQESVGYIGFFAIVMLCCIPTLIVTARAARQKHLVS